jgi:hypothetical protein
VALLVHAVKHVAKIAGDKKRLQIGLTINLSGTKYVTHRKEKRKEPEESGTNGQG